MTEEKFAGTPISSMSQDQLTSTIRRLESRGGCKEVAHYLPILECELSRRRDEGAPRADYANWYVRGLWGHKIEVGDYVRKSEDENIGSSHQVRGFYFDDEMKPILIYQLPENSDCYGDADEVILVTQKDALSQELKELCESGGSLEDNYDKLYSLMKRAYIFGSSEND